MPPRPARNTAATAPRVAALVASLLASAAVAQDYVTPSADVTTNNYDPAKPAAKQPVPLPAALKAVLAPLLVTV